MTARTNKPDKERIEFGPAARRKRDGKLGARIFMHRSAHGWDGQYVIDTHGMTESETVAALTAKRELHRKKSLRLDGFVQSVHNVTFVVNGEAWRVLDCLLLDVANHVELFVQAAPVVGDGFDKRRLVRTTGRYRDMDAVPNDDAILRAIRGAVEGRGTDEAKHELFKQRVTALATGGGE